MTPPPPFGTFPKIHPFWRRHPSLILTHNVAREILGADVSLGTEGDVRVMIGGEYDNDDDEYDNDGYKYGNNDDDDAVPKVFI